jgi:hypothetical protein
VKLTGSGGNGGPFTTFIKNAKDTSQFLPSFNGLDAGKYILILKDKEGCNVVQEAILTQPDSIAIKASITKIPDCTNLFGSIISVEPQGGTPSYDDYTWTGVSIDKVTTIYKTQKGNIINDIPYGTYSVKFMDAKGCIGEKTNMVLTYEKAPSLDKLYVVKKETNDILACTDNTLCYQWGYYKKDNTIDFLTGETKSWIFYKKYENKGYTDFKRFFLDVKNKTGDVCDTKNTCFTRIEEARIVEKPLANNELENQLLHVQIIPNPNYGIFRIAADEIPVEQYEDLMVTDLLGRVIHRQSLRNGNLTVETNDFAVGIYLAHIRFINGQRVSVPITIIQN